MEAAIEETERRVAALTDAETESMTFGSFYTAMKVDLGPEIKAFKKKINLPVLWLLGNGLSS
tara:strand:+ start:199 stop:384 length:186 start_codon:yes stop_codon:yes gene_type:complete